MIILDTNVISEGFRISPNPQVHLWLNAHASSGFCLCAPVLAELRYGVERLPVSRRRNELDRMVTNAERDLFAGEVIPVDGASAREFGRVFAKRAEMGRQIMPMDALIASIAIARNMAVATRDVSDFTGLGIELFNPFDAEDIR